MILQRSSHGSAFLWLLVNLLIPSVLAASDETPPRPIISKVYPNPVSPGDILYVEGTHFIGSSRRLRMRTAEEANASPEGTYVEFATAGGRKRVAGDLLPNPAVRHGQICAVTVPRTAVPGKIKVITLSKRDDQVRGAMSAAVALTVMQETAHKTPTSWSHQTVSLLKAIPQKVVRDAYYYQTERTARDARHAFVRQENLRRLNSMYDVNQSGFFNGLPQIQAGVPRRESDEEAWLVPTGKTSFAAQFFAKPKSAGQAPFYTLSNRETMQKDMQEGVYNYLQPLVERLTGIKMGSDPSVQKTGFTRPKFHVAYSVGLSGNNSSGGGSWARDVGFRLDFDYVHFNPLSEEMRRVMSFSVGADSRRTDCTHEREQRFLFLVRFR